MAWKRFRPSFVCNVFKSVYFGFLVSFLSAVIVGMTSVLVFYLTFQTQLNCLVHPEKSIPSNLQWIIAVSEAIFVFFFHCWLFVNSLFYFRPFQISGLKLTLFLTALAFHICDVCYRVFQALVFFSLQFDPPSSATRECSIFAVSVYSSRHDYQTFLHRAKK